MSQLTFAEAEYDGEKRKTRRENFLERMDGLIRYRQVKCRELVESMDEYI